MTASSWVHRDQLRESWLFLLLGAEKRAEPDTEEARLQLQYWEYGVGNADTLVSTEAAQIGSGQIETESKLISVLLSQLEQYRYQDTAIITRTEEALQTLRRDLLASEIEIASLRGFSNICVEGLLEQYFDQTLADHRLDQDSLTAPRTTTGGSEKEVVSTGSVQEFWEMWVRLYRLLPAAELAGAEL